MDLVFVSGVRGRFRFESRVDRPAAPRPSPHSPLRGSPRPPETPGLPPVNPNATPSAYLRSRVPSTRPPPLGTSLVPPPIYPRRTLCVSRGTLAVSPLSFLNTPSAGESPSKTSPISRPSLIPLPHRPCTLGPPLLSPPPRPPSFSPVLRLFHSVRSTLGLPCNPHVSFDDRGSVPNPSRHPPTHRPAPRSRRAGSGWGPVQGGGRVSDSPGLGSRGSSTVPLSTSAEAIGDRWSDDGSSSRNLVGRRGGG